MDFNALDLSIPQLLDLSKVGDSRLGYITIAENLPFEIRRTYWTYYAPHDVIRGHHAHKALQQVIVSLSGVIDFKIEDFNGNIYEFKLDQPNIGIYIPPLCWREMKFSHNAVLLCMASLEYSEDDYIRNYDTFKKLR